MIPLTFAYISRVDQKVGLKTVYYPETTAHQALRLLPFCFRFNLTPLSAAIDLSSYSSRRVHCKK